MASSDEPTDKGVNAPDSAYALSVRVEALNLAVGYHAKMDPRVNDDAVVKSADVYYKFLQGETAPETTG